MDTETIAILVKHLRDDAAAWIKSDKCIGWPIAYRLFINGWIEKKERPHSNVLTISTLRQHQRQINILSENV